MSGGRNRQKLGQAFDYAKNGGFDEQNDVHNFVIPSPLQGEG
jgi:hypothetical protein